MRRAALAAVALGFAAAACGDERPAGSHASAPAAGRAGPSTATASPDDDAKDDAGPSYGVVPVRHGGAIAGACRLVGQASPAKLDPWPGMGISETRDDESAPVGERLALGGCIVLLRDVGEGKAWPEDLRDPKRAVQITVEDGRYRPHLLLARLGAPLSFTSRMAYDLNVHGYVGAGMRVTAFNFALGPNATVEPDTARVSTPGVYWVTDDLRGHFLLWIRALENPYAEITSAEPRPGRPAGEFRLEDVPPGEYDLLCWHEPMDRRKVPHSGGGFTYVWGPPIERRRRVRVAPDATTTVDFEVPATAK